MANEISLTFRMAVSNGSYDPGAILVSNQQIDQAALGAAEGVQIIGTSEETLATGDLSSEGWLFLRNLDATNFVQIGFSTGVYGARMKAGECAMFRTEAAADIYLLADTANCKVQYRWLEA